MKTAQVRTNNFVGFGDTILKKICGILVGQKVKECEEMPTVTVIQPTITEEQNIKSVVPPIASIKRFQRSA